MTVATVAVAGSLHAFVHHGLPAVAEVAATVALHSRDQAGYAARLHARALPHGFFARLGSGSCGPTTRPFARARTPSH